MSEIRVNNITNRDGSTGTTVAGIPVVDSNSHFVVPTGRTGQRYVDGGENIVRDGLVLHLDAKYSYPSKTGITATTDSLDPDVYTWYDLSGNESHGELINGVGYNATNGGGFIFNAGSLQRINCDRVGIFNSYTVEVWFKSTQVTNYRNVCDMNYGKNQTNTGPRLEQNSSNDLRWYYGDYTDTSYNTITLKDGNMVVNQIYCAVLTYNDSTKIHTAYIDGVKSEEKLKPTSADDSVTPFDSVNFGVGFNGTRFFNGLVYAAKIYNRALTAAEVSQNYNATKGRFGL